MNLLILGLLCQVAAADDLPGATIFPAQLQSRLSKGLAAKGNDYRPRTRHLDKDGRPLFTNRLILEDSPYLVQHAHNPVNWYAWGDEAFERARRENKPIFLSIGYSTCYWCHVMERESFENVQIARFLNGHFVAIKVDRERRPDVDELYMTALLMTEGQGGWPMSGFLMTNAQPFYLGTYFPPDRFLNLLRGIAETWQAQHRELSQQAAEISEAVGKSMQTRLEIKIAGNEVVQSAVTQILRTYDTQWGGFGGAPKFPNESLLMLLLQVAHRQVNPQALSAAEHTLTMMARGGIHDHIGGGFFRYATDERWLVPHFEKMLYNQANLVRVYLKAFQLTGDGLFKRIAGQTLEYVLQEMWSPAGAFYSATDAESDGEEGAYFVWTPEQISQSLTADDARLAQGVFAVSKEGNFRGRNILHLPESLDAAASKWNLTNAEILTRMERIRRMLHKKRLQRAPPLRDEKVLTGWNGMMITALAEASRVLHQPRYLESAIQTAEFLWNEQRREDGSLRRVYLDGRSSITARQEDYAYFAEALIALYDATGEQRWLDRARSLTSIMIEKFWDEEAKGFFMSEDKKLLFALPKQSRDGAIPSGNSVAIHVLAKLSQRVRDWRYQRFANQAIQAFAGSIRRYAGAYPYMMSGIDELLHGAVGTDEYLARGEIKASALEQMQGERYLVLITLDIPPGWHINSNEPRQKDLTPLAIELTSNNSDWRIHSVKYPKPIYKKLSFEDELLSLYQGKTQVIMELQPPTDIQDFADRRVDVRLHLQACNNEICLPPEKPVLEMIY